MPIHPDPIAPVQREPWRPNPSQVVLSAFVAFIAVGAVLLSLPIAHAGARHHWVDDLFTAASAVCVTGLATVDVADSYSLVGQGLILLLIQVGGLGYMTLFTVSLLIVGRRLSMRDRIALQEATDQPGLTGLGGFFLKIVRFTLAVEALGALALALRTVPELGWGRGLYVAVFHAVSAFNNAGFSLYPEGLIHWQGEAWLLVVVAALIVVGGLGYNVNHELVDRLIYRRRPNHRWDLLMRLVLVMTAVLLAGSTALFWAFEHANPHTLGAMSAQNQLVNAFFMAVQPRTAGFNSVDTALLDRPTLMMTLVLMVIGGGPGGTAGGIKLTTVAIVIAAVLASARGQNEVTLFNFRRTISDKHVRKAFTVMTVSLAVIGATAIGLATIEPHPFLPLLFEAASAFATVGMSMGITASLSTASKLLLVGTMLVGRVGVLVLMLSLLPHRRTTTVHYMEEPLLIG